MRSKESEFSCDLVKALNTVPHAHFRKTSDRAQVGLPDIVGCLEGLHVEIEVKQEKIIDPTKLLPTGHYFTGPQMKELAHINSCGGVGIGVIATGSLGFAFPSRLINDAGRIKLAEHTQVTRIPLPDVKDLIWMIKSLSRLPRN